MIEIEDFNVTSPELLRELQRVRAGVLTAFVNSEGAAEKLDGIVREIAVSLGIRIEYEVLITDYQPLLWKLGVRRVSALNPDKPKFAFVGLNSVRNPLEVGRFLRKKLFDVIDDSEELIEFYAQEPRSSKLSSCNHAVPRIIYHDSKIAAKDELDESILPSPRAYAKESVTAFDSEYFEEQGLDDEKKRWVDALSSLIVQYMMRFNEAPPMEMIEASVRGKILLTASKKSPLTVSGDMKVYLPELNEIQLRMTPLATTVYILFLCHPEGIRLKDIENYRHELEEIYSMVKPGASESVAKASIDGLVDPVDNSLNEKLSMIRRSINRYILDKQMAEHYIISGKRGEVYRIALDPELITLPESLKSLIGK